MSLKNIILKKKKGISSLMLQIIGFFLVLFLVIIIFIVHTSYQLHNEGVISQNAVIMANRSIYNPQNLDLNTLSENPNQNYIGIKDPNLALQTWEKHLQYNLNLNSSYCSNNNTSFIKSKVDIKDFILYNLDNINNTVTVYTLNTSTMLFNTNVYSKDAVKDPKGRTIKVSCVYSTIGFTINVIGNYTKYVTVNKEDGAYKAIINTSK